MNNPFRYCPNCGTQNPKEAKECYKCGLLFEKFKPFDLKIEKEKEKKSNLFLILISIVGISFISYMLLIVIIERHIFNPSESRSPIYNMVSRLEIIYHKIPIENPEQKTKYLNEINFMEKLVSTFPVSEDVEKLNLFEENLRDIKIILTNNKIDLNLKKKIEERFSKLK